MTTANLMNVPSVSGGYAVQADTSKKLQDDNLKVAETFAGIVNQVNAGYAENMAADIGSDKTVKVESKQSAAESYERYGYKDKRIDNAKSQNVSEKLEEKGETLEQAEKDIVDAISEEYDVSEEEINKLLEELGLSVLDLLDPQNLVSFVVSLTGAGSGEELLMDENFLSVMETLADLTEGLMQECDVDAEGLQALIAAMETVDETAEFPQDAFVQELTQAMTETQAVSETDAEPETDVQMTDVENAQVPKDSTKSEMDAKVQNDDEAETEPKKQTEESETAEIVEHAETKLAKESDASESNLAENSQSNTNENVVLQQNDSVNVSQNAEVGQTQFSSYMSADSVQIMEQIVQKMRVTVTPDTTSMEMQLNPENLGKVYVKISSEEGVVNAQFHATNEVVKEALETQVASLRESLNQAGVKVDAIEVTIASHEFERNLEQNHQNPEDNKDVQENATAKRRNISMDSLDELSGIMTEEETLVAQMMKDNGNSVDFTA